MSRALIELGILSLLLAVIGCSRDARLNRYAEKHGIPDLGMYIAGDTGCYYDPANEKINDAWAVYRIEYYYFDEHRCIVFDSAGRVLRTEELTAEEIEWMTAPPAAWWPSSPSEAADFVLASVHYRMEAGVVVSHHDGVAAGMHSIMLTMESGQTIYVLGSFDSPIGIWVELTDTESTRPVYAFDVTDQPPWDTLIGQPVWFNDVQGGLEPIVIQNTTMPSTGVAIMFAMFAEEDTDWYGAELYVQPWNATPESPSQR